MLLRVVFFMLMALGLIGFGTVAWIATRPPQSEAAVLPAAPPPAPKKNVLAVAHPVKGGTLLKPEDLESLELTVPQAAGLTLDTPDARKNFVGSMARHDLGADEPIREADVMKPGEHGFLAAVLAPGMRAVTIGVDATSGAAGLVWPGDRVDLILTQAMSDASLPPGQRVAAETVLSDVRVIAIDQQLVQAAASGESRTVTLEVTRTGAERVSVATRIGRLSLSVRASAGGHAVGDAAAADSRPTYAGDVSPALSNEPKPASESMVRVFQGSGDVREFKY
jgi:pilus assembly protein CpaB